jgi:1-phosphofructokinase family hexose kinase
MVATRSNVDRGCSLCLAVTPAVQRTQFFTTLRPGEVNRIRRTIITASGKGVNVALALRHVGGHPRLLGFRGGDGGAFIANEMARLGIEARWIEVPAPTRHCHTLIEDDTGRITELVEEAPPPSPEHWRQLADQLAEALTGCAWMAISGALPPGAPPDALTTFCQAATARGVRLCVDSQGEPLLHTLVAKPAIVKLNTEELQRTCNLPDRSAASLDRGAARLMQRGASAVLVTDGAQPAHLFSGSNRWTLQPPSVRVVNPIGSGDSVTAGLLFALQQDQSLLEAAAFGLACGSANAVTETPGLLDADRAQQLAGMVIITPNSG